MQEDTHVFQGMKLNTHPIKLDSNFLWEAHNIRLTNREDNTLFSITNEKGTKDTGLSFNGIYLGHCVLGKYLVVFTVDESNTSYIYRINKLEDGTLRNVLLVRCEGLLNKNYPIQALGIEETPLVNKIYWVDGFNLPRKINITLPELRGAPADLGSYSYLYENNDIDFIPELSLKEVVDIVPNYGDGIFSPGVIQYAFTYFNKYSSESNIFYTTPLLYISHLDRGGSPDSSIAMSFLINISNTDNFEYVRVYSIHRTSLSALPSVKIVKDVKVTKSMTIIDDGTTGSIVDPTLLLYIGGKSIIANCIEQKDLTLFLGNITTLNNDIPNVQVKIPRETEGSSKIEYLTLKTALKGGKIEESFRNIPQIQNKSTGYYSYTNLLSCNTSTFKSRDWYRLGIQVLWKDGNWSDPIFILDYTITKQSDLKEDYLLLPIIRKEIRSSVVKKLIEEGYKKARGVVVFPDYSDRKVFALGMLCPTVFNAKNRLHNSPYALSSWFLRPFNATDSFPDSNINPELGAAAEYQHLGSLGSNNRGGIRSAELGGDKSFHYVNNLFKADPEVKELDNNFYVDLNIITFHSPDVEFNNSLVLSENINYKLKIVGLINFTASKGDIDILTSSPTINADSLGFYKPLIGVLNKSIDSIRSLISGPFYKDRLVLLLADGKYIEGTKEIEHFVFLWDGESLNNDIKRSSEGGTRTAVLQYKKISNLKYSAYNTWLSKDLQKIYNIPKVLLFNSNEISLSKIEGSPRSIHSQLNYYGNVDTMVYPNLDNYVSYEDNGTSVIKSITELLKDLLEAGIDWIQLATNSDKSARVKYKSTPHIVLSLGNTTGGASNILPSVSNINKFDYGNKPFWFKDSISDTLIDSYYDYKVAYVINTEIKLSLNTLYLHINNNVKILTGDYIIENYNNGNRCEGYLYQAVNTANNNTSYQLIQIDESMVTANKIYGYYDNKSSLYVYQYKAKYLGNGYYMVLEDAKFFDSSSLLSYYLDNISNVDIKYPYLFLAELIRDEATIKNPFGGNNEYDITLNLWCPAGEPIELIDNDLSLYIKYEYGDTWYLRYDCLKTYPFTNEDENLLVEIGSFMCETRLNIDGRYDRNRGLDSNINMSPQNFNLMNDVYSQKDNFFNYKVLPTDFYKQNNYNRQIIWSKEKFSGELTDTWTNITLANTLDLDGSKGEITAIKSFNELLVAFQEQAISKINFNSRVQIPTSDGVPIEISNSYKVDGYDTYSNIIGCQDKNSIITTEEGIYFIDNNSNSLYKFNGLLANISDTLGMKSWFKDNKFNYKWEPIPGALNKNNGIRSFYDYENGDIYFTPGWDNIDDKYIARDALCYSNKLQAFSSLMSYGGTLAMFNYCGDFYSLRYNPNKPEEKIKMHLNNAGDYNEFYGETKGWDFSFISNEGSSVTKVFDTIDTRADHYDVDSGLLLNTCPFNFIRSSNEYLDTKEVTLDNKNMRKKFRIWRGLIPRNYGTRERIRNPWTMITLGWNPSKKKDTESNNYKAIVHDVTAKYTV